MTRTEKKFIIINIRALTTNYEDILIMLKDNDKAREYFEEGIAKLEHCIDNL